MKFSKEGNFNPHKAIKIHIMGQASKLMSPSTAILEGPSIDFLSWMLSAWAG